MTEALCQGGERAQLRSRVFESFAALPADYTEGLRREVCDQGLFSTWDWFETLAARGLDPSDRVRLYGVETENGAPQALFPARFHNHARSSFSELSSLSNYYSSLFVPLARSGVEPNQREMARAFVKAVRSERPAWDAVNLRPMDPASEMFRVLVEEFRKAGYAVQTYFCFGNWYLEVGGRSYQEYAQGLSSVITKNVKRATNQLVNTGRAQVEIVTTRAGIDAAMTAYEAVYAASWKHQEPRPEFIRDLVARCADLGWLRLGTVFLDGAAVASQIWIVQGGTASIYKIAYDEKYAKHSLGTLLSARMMQHVIDVDRVSCVDYLTGDDSYKQRWMSHRRERWGILAVNPRTVHGMLAMIKNLGGWLPKSWRLKKTAPVPAKHD